MFELILVGQEDLLHRGASDLDEVRIQPFFYQVIIGVMGIGKIKVGDMVDDDAIRHLGHIPIPASIAGLHME